MIFHQLFFFVYCVRRMKTLLCSGLVCIYSPSSPQSSSASSSSVSVDFDFPKFFSFFLFAAARLRAKIRMERKHLKLFYLCVEHEIVLMRLLPMEMQQRNRNILEWRSGAFAQARRVHEKVCYQVSKKILHVHEHLIVLEILDGFSSQILPCSIVGLTLPSIMCILSSSVVLSSASITSSVWHELNDKWIRMFSSRFVWVTSMFLSS